ISCLAFALPTLLYGSGFLAVYVAGIVLGNGRLPYRQGIFRAHDFVAWSSQVFMFLMLGFLASPMDVFEVAGPGIVIAVVLALVARPVSVFILPFRYGFKERLWMS